MDRALGLAASLALLSGCEDDGTGADAGTSRTRFCLGDLGAVEGDGGAGEPAADAGVPGDDGSGPTHLLRIESLDEYAQLAAEGDEVKYLNRVDGRSPPAPLDNDCQFQNTRRFPFHIQFLHLFEELSHIDFDTYLNLIMFDASRVWWGGELKLWPGVAHPISGALGIIEYSVLRDQSPTERLTADQFTESDARMKGCMPFAASTLVLVPSGVDQEAHVRTICNELVTRGVAVLFAEDLAASIDVRTYSLGEGYGHLEVVPRGTMVGSYGPRDVIVADTVPDGLAVVAGLITALPQSIHSHVNLRLREKRIPNAFVRDIYDNANVLALDGRLVHVVVDGIGARIEPATLDDAERFWQTHAPRVGPVCVDLRPIDLRSFADMRATDHEIYGAKAANLGELHGILPPESRVEGFGIPVSAYLEFLEHNGLQPLIDQILSDERILTDSAHRRSRLDDIRAALRAGEVPPGFLDVLVSRLREVFGPDVDTTRIRFRSSTNVEDLDELSGAGLYRSRGGCLADSLDEDEIGPSACLSGEERAHLENELARREDEIVDHPERYWLNEIIADLRSDLTEEKPIERALKAVWSSLFRQAAFDERDYYGIDQRVAHMAMAVNPSFVLERREAVALTELRVDDGMPLYRLVSQVGDVGVVRPDDPTAVPETLTFRRAPDDTLADVRLVVPSSLSQGGAPLWSEGELAELASLLFLVHDHFGTQVYSHIEPPMLDVEIELTADGRIVIKQARPYLGSEF